MKFNSLILISVLTAFLFGCSSSTKKAQTCQELDWYEIGRQDGTKGLDLTQHKKVRVVCIDSDQSLAEALYYNGFDSGAAQYCSPENGFELGRRGQKINDICPPMLKEAFNKKYNQGMRAATLTKQSLEIDKQLKSIQLSMDDHSVDNAKKELLAAEKIQLTEKKQAVEFELRAINSNDLN